MYKYLTGIMCLFFLLPFYALAQPYDFSTKKLATDFMEEKEALGKRANLTVQKQEKQRYSVLLKGYLQWGTAFKQAQFLEKQGFSELEVVKGRYERGYSIIVQQSLNKKAIGKSFNQLRALGMKNVKVHADKIKLVRYIVTVYELKPETLTSPKQFADGEKSSGAPEALKPQTPLSSQQHTEKMSTRKQISSTSEDEINFGDDAMIIVMSDSADITYDIDMQGEDDFEWAVDKVVLENELFTRSSSTVDHVQYVHASGLAKWQLSNQWEVQLAARIDGNYQHGDDVSDTDELDLDYGNTFLRYRDNSMRLTVGADTVRWGKMDIFSPTDNMATLDLTRGVLYEWGENYRSAPIIRGEFFLHQSKLDIVYLPYFREAELPDDDNVWHPANGNEGALLGFGSTPLLKALLQNGKIDDDINSTDGGFGIRYSGNVNSIDFDLTVQQVKLSAPYYQINPAIVANPSLLGQEKYSFIERHPRSWILGGNVEFQADSAILRFEAAWFSDLPATTKSFKYETYEGFKWAGGAEFYPGDGDTRINLQISGSHIDEKESIFDRDNIITLNGEVEALFSNNRWKLSGRFNLGLDEKDVYIAPEIAYLGWEPFEIYSAIHYLEGEDETVGGFFEKNTMVTIGWRGQF